MIQLIELVPLALVIAVNPMPIMAVLLMLSTRGGVTRSVGFAAGWLLGVAFATTTFSYLSSFIPMGYDREPLVVIRVLPIVVGGALVAAGLFTWRRRSAAAERPKWTAGLDRLSVARSAGIAFAFATIKPKNVALTAAAGVIILDGHPPLITIVLLLVIFTLVASSTLIMPVLLHRFGSTRMRAFLDSARRWLTRAMPTITSSALVLLGSIVTVAGIMRW
ncbi:GAP family protein [Agreia sp.]|uniref:GAP family protein n=1 Tax=Agreia sp. TaxID=1872416 RepID=UPI0035BC7A6E